MNQGLPEHLKHIADAITEFCEDSEVGSREAKAFAEALSGGKDTPYWAYFEGREHHRLALRSNIERALTEGFDDIMTRSFGSMTADMDRLRRTLKQERARADKWQQEFCRLLIETGHTPVCNDAKNGQWVINWNGKRYYVPKALVKEYGLDEERRQAA